MLECVDVHNIRTNKNSNNISQFYSRLAKIKGKRFCTQQLTSISHNANK